MSKREWRKADFKQRARFPVGEILETLRLEELLDALGLTSYREVQGKFQMACPLPSHPGKDSNPSFAVMRDGLSFNCFTCGIGGTVTNLVMQLQNVTEEEALIFMLEFSDASMVGDEDHTKFQRRVKKYLNRPAKKIEMLNREPDLPWYHPDVLEPWLEAADQFDWLGERKIGPEARAALKLGYAEEYEKGDYVGPALVVPHFVKGVLCGWQARFLEDDRPKYVHKFDNTDDFPKKETLYGMDLARTAEGPIYVVESALTVARLLSAGFPAVATFSAQVSDRQMRQLRLLVDKRLVVSYDSDPPYKNKRGKWVKGAGVVATERIVETLSQYGSVDMIPPHIPGQIARRDKADLGDLTDAQLDEALMYVIPHFLR